MKRFIRVIATILLICSACLFAACGRTPVEGDDSAAPHLERQDAIVKKGVSVSRYDDGSEKSAELLEDLGISWYYNWGSSDFADNIDAEYVPMVWGVRSVNENILSGIREGFEAGKYNYLLTFNEPDYESQSNISVETALELWPKLEELGIPLSSPAPAYYTSGWLDEFMTQANARGYRVDFLALHCYQDFGDVNAVAQLRQELIEIYERYQLPIWITEFAAIDTWVWGGHSGNPACTLDAAKRYTKEVTDMLESLAFVERYAWFIDNTNSPDEVRGSEAQYTFLYNNDDTLSETGEIYKAQPSATPLQIFAAVPKGKVGKEYGVTLTASGGTGDYIFSDRAPDGVTVWNGLPEGLSLSPAGKLTGKPQKAGIYTLCIAATDEAGQTAFNYFRLIIES